MSKTTQTKTNNVTRKLTVAIVMILFVLQFGILLKIYNDNQAILKNQSVQGLRLLYLDPKDSVKN